MRLQATDEEVIEMAKLAIMASKPIGLGYLHFNPDLKIEDIAFQVSSPITNLYVDYFQGRMVKFVGRKISEGTWSFNDQISSEYQSWISKYASYEELHSAARRSLSQM